MKSSASMSKTLKTAAAAASQSKPASDGKEAKGSADKTDSKEIKQSQEKKVNIESQDFPDFDFVSWSSDHVKNLSEKEWVDLEKRAQKDDKDACFYYGIALECGLRGKKKDSEAAFPYFEKAAIAKHYFAQLKLAQYYSGDIGRKDVQKAIDILMPWGSKDNGKAHFYLGNCFCAQEKFTDALKAYEGAVKKGHIHAKYQLGRLLLGGAKGCIRKPVYGLDLLEQASKSSTLPHSSISNTAKLANKELYLIYQYGKYDIPQNLEKAIEHLKEAAEAGDLECMYSLGEYLLKNKGINKEESAALALQWIDKAAQGGWAPASYWLFEYNLKQNPQNLAIAKKHLEKAANDGYEQAVLACAEHAYRGTFDGSDIKSYKEWLTRGAERGYGVALNNYGLLHLSLGFDYKPIKDQLTDRPRAFKSLVAALKTGYKPALYHLASLFYHKDANSILKDDKMYFSLLFHCVNAKEIPEKPKGIIYFYLGKAFEEGRGVPDSLDSSERMAIAHFMYFRAAPNYPEAEKEYDEQYYTENSEASFLACKPTYSYPECVNNLEKQSDILDRVEALSQQKMQQLQREDKEQSDQLETTIREQKMEIESLKLEIANLENEYKEDGDALQQLTKNVENLTTNILTFIKTTKSGIKRSHEIMSSFGSTGSSASASASSMSVPDTPTLLVLSDAARAATNPSRSANSSATDSARTNGSASTTAMSSTETVSDPAKEIESDGSAPKKHKT